MQRTGSQPGGRVRRDILEIDTALAPVVSEARILRGDVENLRLLLTGGSVVDWHKASFGSRSDVDRLLNLHQFDLEDPVDQQRLRWLFSEAVTYLEEYLHLRVPSKIRGVEDVREVFLWAANAKGFRRTQVLSCMILKLMHVLQHLEAAELRTRITVPERRLHDIAHLRVAEAAERMRDAHVPLVAFYGSRKTRAGIISKLLSKRDDIAARVFDKLRYRVVVPEHRDLVPALAWLTHHLVPFNLGIPDQAHDNLLDPASLGELLTAEDRAQLQALPEEELAPGAPQNEFSGVGYRMINFIVDVPIRLAPDDQPPDTEVSLGRVVYVTTEFQVVDEATAERNEQGESAHQLYKKRQLDKVLSRLTRGQYQRGPS